MNTSLIKLLQLVCKTESQNRLFAIDVGAHHGEFSKFLINTNFFSKVLAFEPNLDSYSATQNTVFSLPDCVFEVINVALSSESGLLDLYSDADTATASLLRYDASYQNQGQIKKHSVSVISLDEYLDGNLGNFRLQLLKIDTQGNDLAVIKGARQVILRHRPIIQTEFIYIQLYEGQCSPKELFNEFATLNYEMYSLNNLHITSEGRLAYCDAIFIPKELCIPVTQVFTCIDDQMSFQSQVKTLTDICAERLAVINVLDSEVQRFRNADPKASCINNIFSRLKSWVQ